MAVAIFCNSPHFSSPAEIDELFPRSRHRMDGNRYEEVFAMPKDEGDIDDLIFGDEDSGISER